MSGTQSGDGLAINARRWKSREPILTRSTSTKRRNKKNASLELTLTLIQLDVVDVFKWTTFRFINSVQMLIGHIWQNGLIASNAQLNSFVSTELFPSRSILLLCVSSRCRLITWISHSLIVFYEALCYRNNQPILKQVVRVALNQNRHWRFVFDLKRQTSLHWPFDLPTNNSNESLNFR